MSELVKKLQHVSDLLDEIDEYHDCLGGMLSQTDLKIQDLLHYIENNKISVLWAYKYIVELKRLRLERRKIKNDMCILSKYNEHRNKLISNEYRRFLMTEIHKIEKQLETPYKNRQYKDGEIDEILKKSSKK